MGVYDTEIITGYLEHCDDIGELKKQILSKLQDQRDRCKEKIEQILNESGYSCKQLALLCGVSEPAVRKWRKGSLPQNRDMFIRIGFAAGYHIDEMNSFLQRYGRCPKLYFKSLEDCVCMFVLNSKSLPHTYRCYEDVLNYVKGELERESLSEQFAYSTSQLSAYFANLDSMEEMIRFAKPVRHPIKTRIPGCMIISSHICESICTMLWMTGMSAFIPWHQSQSGLPLFVTAFQRSGTGSGSHYGKRSFLWVCT